MKRFYGYWVRATVSFFLVALIASAFWVGNVYATTGCFNDTNGHWAETFICWMKDNGISTGYGGGLYKPENNVTRAEMSVFLQKTYNLANNSAQAKANTAETNAKAYADSLVNVPPETGLILITPGAGGWVKFSSADNLSFDNYSSYTVVKKSNHRE